MEPMVSIVCTTFNHGKYIGDAIESFLRQETSFPFEIIIHDDASTDNTAEIVKKYENRYPKTVKAIYQKRNQYSMGISISTNYIYPIVKGKYIAFCEGDDYWTDNGKLQIQYNFMERNDDCSMCYHGVQIVNRDAIAQKDKVIGPYGKGSRHYTVKDIGKSGFVHLTSMFCRSELLTEKCPDWVVKPIGGIHGDIRYAIYFACKGYVYYIDQIMSAYRFGVLESAMYLKRTNYNLAEEIQISENMIELIDYIDADFNKYHTSELHELRRYYEYRKYKLYYPKSREILKSEYSDFFMELSAKDKLKLIIKNNMPFAAKLIKRLLEKIR